MPRTLSLKATIAHYIAHQVEIITRRTAYRLRKAQERAHVLDGYIIALDNLDAVIALIRGRGVGRGRAAASCACASTCRRSQARAILDMQLRRLAALERQDIVDEHAELVRPSSQSCGESWPIPRAFATIIVQRADGAA